MYTVILYHNGTRVSIEKYMFMFQSLREDGLISWYNWKDQDEAEDMMKALNLRTQGHYEWRLIIFEGDSECLGEAPEDTIPEKISRLICSYSHAGKIGYVKIKGCCPQQMWYVGYRKKPSAAPCYTGKLIQTDSGRRYGSGFRMLWMEIDFSCEVLRQYSLFRVACGLLILAVNQFPPGILEYGYLYKLTVEIEHNKFEEYILREEIRLTQIFDDLLQEIESLRRRNMYGVDYPGMVAFNYSLDNYRNKIEQSEKFQKVIVRNMYQLGVLQNILTKNRRVVWSRLYFPKGILREEASRIQEDVSRRKRAGGFLSEAGKDMLEREKREAFEKMSEKRHIQLNYQEFEWEFRKNEEDIKLQTEYMLSISQRMYLCIILLVIESIILMPFIWYIISIAKMKFSTFLIIAVCSSFLAVFIVSIYFFWRMASFIKINRYNKHFVSKLENRQEEKTEYLESILESISKYQYCIELEEEQEEQKADAVQRRRRLMRHRFVCESSLIICRQLKYFLSDRNDLFGDVPALSVNFEEEPQNIEYYWIPYKRSPGMADVNRSGSKVKVFFDFISEFLIEKTEY